MRGLAPVTRVTPLEALPDGPGTDYAGAMEPLPWPADPAPEVGPPTRDRVRLLDGGREAFPPMLDAIGEARDEILCEVYQLAVDRVGERFIEALSAAAARGVRVRVVIDGWGSSPDTGEVAQRLGSAGCEVEIFNRMVLVLIGRWRRNHRKLLVVDGEVAFVGGINMSADYGVPGEASGLAWADLALEIRGPTARWLQRRGRRERGRSPAAPLRIWLSGLGGGRRLRRRYLKAIGAAQHRVLLAHAYFLPDRHLVRSITAAARRGVQVQLVVPARADVSLAGPAMRRLYRRLLPAGVEVREWPGLMMHAKVAVIDGTHLLLGSFNLDPFSLANLEVLAEAEDQEVAQAGQRWIEARLDEARPVPPAAPGAGAFGRWWENRLGALAARLVSRLGRWLSRG
jgi:cardiolipin synthase